MLFPKDEKIEKIEKRLDKLERLVNRKFSQVESSFKLFRDVVLKLQNDKDGLDRERSLLLEKQKELLSKIEIENHQLSNMLLEPVRNEIKENIEIIRKVAKDL